MRSSTSALVGVAFAAAFCALTTAARAETVMQQCGQQYQAAKAGGTLNGMTWNQFRSDCAAKLKAQPASATAPAPAATPAVQTTNPLNPAPAVVPAPAPTTAAPAAQAGQTGKPSLTGGRAAFVVRERECGSEWRASKVTLIAQTPGLTWPKYLSQCNTRLKAAGK